MSKDRRKEDLAEHGGWYLKKTDAKCLKAVFLHKHTYIYIGWDEWEEVNYRPRTFLYFGVGNRRGESKERRWNVRVTERWVWWQRVSEGVKDEKVLWKGELVSRNKVQPSIQIFFFIYHRTVSPSSNTLPSLPTTHIPRASVQSSGDAPTHRLSEPTGWSHPR